jgi:hypothetical protein
MIKLEGIAACPSSAEAMNGIQLETNLAKRADTTGVAMQKATETIHS